MKKHVTEKFRIAHKKNMPSDHQQYQYQANNTQQQSRQLSTVINHDLQNGNFIKIFYINYKNIDKVQLILLLMNIFLLVCYFQYQIHEIVNARNLAVTNTQNSPIGKQRFIGEWNFTLFCGFIICICSVFCSLLRFLYKNLLLEHQHLQLSTWSDQIIQFIIILIHPLPFYLPNLTISLSIPYHYMYQEPNNHSPYCYNMQVNHIILLFSFLKVILIVRSAVQQLNISLDFLNFKVNFNKFFTPSAQRLCKMYGCEDSSMIFAQRCIFKEYPLVIMIFLVLLLMTILAYLMRICQCYYDQSWNASPNLIYFENCLWLIFITMSTVGFGDLYPMTTPGMIVCGITIIISAFLFALLLAFTNQVWSYNQKQRDTVRMLKKLQISRFRKHHAGHFLALAIKRLRQNKKSFKKDQKKDIKKKSSIEERRHYLAFKKFTNEYRDNVCDKNDQFRQMYNNFEITSLMFNDILQSSTGLTKMVSEKYFDQSFKYYKKNKQNTIKRAITNIYSHCHIASLFNKQ